MFCYEFEVRGSGFGVRGSGFTRTLKRALYGIVDVRSSRRRAAAIAAASNLEPRSERDSEHEPGTENREA
jgi:hypothetical protein